MRSKRRNSGRLWLGGLASVLSLLSVTTQAQSTVTNGVVAYWNFDLKNFKDSIAQFDGTANGADPIAFVEGKSGFGQAMKLNGVDQYVEITGGAEDDLAFEGGSMSIAGWFTVDSFDKSWQALIAKGEGSNWRVHRNGSNPTMAYAGGVGEGPNDGPDISDGLWHHFVGVSDADAASFGTAIYVDGVQTSVNATAPALAANGKRVFIGENPDALGRFWNGKVDDLALWNRVLKEDEIKALYNGGTGKPLSSFFTPDPDSDKDGMPDSFETKYGLNPNDATDAAKDCNNNGVTNLDEYKAGLDPCDTVKPTVVSATGNSTFDSIKLTFSEALDASTATNLANYAISPSLTISAVAYKNKVVTLTTAKQTPATAYTVTLKGIKDLSKNEVATGTTVTVNSFVMTKNGLLKFSYFGDLTDPSGANAIFGTAVQGLYDDPRFPNTPDLVLPVYSFNSRDAFPDDSHENYGGTLEGFLTPKESGSYRFFIYTDDSSELFLSTDDKSANLVKIAEETGCCNNFTEPGATHDEMLRTSDPVALVAGKKYFIRLVYKEGGGGDYGQVAWRKEGDTTAANKLKPIPAEFLSAEIDLPGPPPVEQANIPDGLVAYWNFDGHFLDSIKDFNGTGKGTNPVAFVDGKAGFGKAIKLDGTDQYVEITGGNENELEFAGGSMSIAGWFKVDAFDTEWQALIAKGEGSNYRIARRSLGNSVAYAGGTGEGADDVPNINDGKWHHFVAVSDAKTNKFGTALYIDGVIHGINPAKPVLTANSAHLFIGENPEAKKREWKGEIDDIGIWNRVLNETEIATLYKGGAGTAVSTLPGIKTPSAGGPTFSSVARTGNNLVIAWTTGTLEQADSVTGPWTPVAGAASPATIPISGAGKFFRLK